MTGGTIGVGIRITNEIYKPLVIDKIALTVDARVCYY